MKEEYQLLFLGNWFRVPRWIYHSRWHNCTGIKRIYEDSCIYQFNRPKWGQKLAVLHKR